MTFLKNYTSGVPVSQTIYRIEQVLIKCGVSGITKEYGPQGEISAIRFHIKPGKEAPEMTVRLPADRDKALDALWLDYVDGDKLNEKGTQIVAWGSRKRKTKQEFVQQAERTAWKIIQDWVEVQMSMIQMKQAEYPEVFLPYVWDGKATVYQRLKANNFSALALPERT